MSYPIETIEGIGPKYKKMLKKVGVTSTKQLLDKGAKKKGRQDLAKESLSRRTISATLHKNIKHVTILIHGSPEIILLPANRHKDLVDEPIVAELAFASFKGTVVAWTKLQTPTADRFVRYNDTSFGE